MVNFENEEISIAGDDCLGLTRDRRREHPIVVGILGNAGHVAGDDDHR